MNNEEKILNLLENMKTDITTMKTDITTMKTDITTMQTSINDLKEGQDKSNARLDRMEVELAEVKSIAIKTHDKTAQLVEFSNETDNKLERIIEENKSVHGLLGEHEIKIRTMQKRPV
ncbi:MAG: hypothetical protein PHF82_06865 [Lutispora sp.]|nr:hypothetical protein [Lutispora sp.]